MNRPFRLVICGNYGATNLGDEAILQSILDMIERTKISTHITVMSANPHATSKVYACESVYFVPAGVKSLLRGVFHRELRKTLRAIKNCDGFILGGGGLFNGDHPRAIMIWFLQAWAALLYKKPLFCLGQSVGPLKQGWARTLVKKIFQVAKIITVRDEGSKNLLHSLGITKVQVLADPVFGLTSAHTMPQKKQDYVVFSIRPWSQVQAEKNYETLAQFMDYLFEKHQLRSVLIPFQIFHDDDAKILAYIQSKTHSSQMVKLHPYSEKPTDILPIIANAKAVVGMRLHSLIFATLTHTPFLALSYSQKVTDMMRLLDTESSLLSWENFTFEDLTQQFEALLAQEGHLRQKLAQKATVMEAQSQKHVELLRVFLSAN